MARLSVQCNWCSKFFFDDDYQNNYKDSIFKSLGDFVKITRNCPYCDHISESLTTIPNNVVKVEERKDVHVWHNWTPKPRKRK
jgi:hypothetical protein